MEIDRRYKAGVRRPRRFSTIMLRGEAGPRQVDGASTGLTHTLGGNTATVLVSLFGRD